MSTQHVAKQHNGFKTGTRTQLESLCSRPHLFVLKKWRVLTNPVFHFPIFLPSFSFAGCISCYNWKQCLGNDCSPWHIHVWNALVFASKGDVYLLLCCAMWDCVVVCGKVNHWIPPYRLLMHRFSVRWGSERKCQSIGDIKFHDK